jgi:hypothetical protein
MLSCMPKNLGDFLRCERTPFPRLKSTERHRPDGDSDQTQRGVPHRSRHATDLPIDTFVQRDCYPRGRHILPKPDRHRTIRHRWRIGEHPDLRRLGEMVSAISLSLPLHSQLYLFSGPVLDKIPEAAWLDHRQLTHLT